MKKLVLATAVAALYATSAQAAPTVYGKAGVALEYNDGSEVTELKDIYGSRIGVKGAIKATDGLKAIYKAEFGINAFDQGEEKTAFKNRVTYVGIGSDQMGMITAGRQSNFAKGVADDYNLFDSVGAEETIGKSRHGNVIAYTSPSSLPIELQAGVVLSEEKDGDNGYIVQGTYADNGLRLGLGGQFSEADNSDDIISVGADYDFGMGSIGGGYQYTTETENSRGHVGAKYKVAGTPIALKGQVVYVEDMDKEAKNETSFAVGAEYKLAKKAKAEVYAGQNFNEDTIIGTGLEYKF